jgi:energy-coupling factor transport system permease protein
LIRNPIAWCAWALATLGAAFIDRNPFLQALLLLVLINVWLPYRHGRPTYLRVSLALAAIPVLFSVGLSRFGSHAIFTLPGWPIVGGPLTWDALAFGANTGLALMLTIAVFGIVQSTVRSADLVSLLPRPLYRLGTVFALSIAFTPKAIASFHSIQEARALRSERTGWRGVPAVIVPLLLSTLEQALQYGESLDARGYGNQRRSRYRPIAWSVADAIATLFAALSIALLIAFPAAPYDAYDSLVPKTPSGISAIAVLSLAAPAVLAALSGARR